MYAHWRKKQIKPALLDDDGDGDLAGDDGGARPQLQADNGHGDACQELEPVEKEPESDHDGRLAQNEACLSSLDLSWNDAGTRVLEAEGWEKVTWSDRDRVAFRPPHDANSGTVQQGANSGKPAVRHRFLNFIDLSEELAIREGGRAAFRFFDAARFPPWRREILLRWLDLSWDINLHPPRTQTRLAPQRGERPKRARKESEKVLANRALLTAGAAAGRERLRAESNREAARERSEGLESLEGLKRKPFAARPADGAGGRCAAVPTPGVPGTSASGKPANATKWWNITVRIVPHVDYDEAEALEAPEAAAAGAGADAAATSAEGGGARGGSGLPEARAELKLALPERWRSNPLSALLELVFRTLDVRSPASPPAAAAADGGASAKAKAACATEPACSYSSSADLVFYLYSNLESSHRGPGAPLAPDALVGDALYDGAQVVTNGESRCNHSVRASV